ncbi:unnamed protein product, partial [Allacma fusca]
QNSYRTDGGKKSIPPTCHKKGRYKHAVKSELISFCYASSDPSSDIGLVPASSRNRDFVKTLMGIVEKDKEVADLAVGLVEDMDALERAKTGYVSKRSGHQTEESTFQQIWENHKTLRKQIAGILVEERKEIYGEKNVGGDVKIFRRNLDYDDDSGEDIDEAEMLDQGFEEAVKLEKETMASDIVPETDEDMREKEIRRGIQKIMRRLGCDDAYSSGSYQCNLKIIQKHFQALKQDIRKLKE